MGILAVALTLSIKKIKPFPQNPSPWVMLLVSLLSISWILPVILFPITIIVFLMDVVVCFAINSKINYDLHYTSICFLFGIQAWLPVLLFIVYLMRNHPSKPDILSGL
jgi:hypothetical protein